MTLAIVLVIAAILALTLVVSLTVRQSLEKSKASQSYVEPIDIEAFRNLVDPEETEFLRRRLPPWEFRTVQRQRLHAMASYVQVAGRNAAVLAVIGQSALSSSDAHTAEAARQLVDHALLLRRNAAFALLRINLALAWPTLRMGAIPVLRGYERLNGSAMLLGRLQNPAVPVRISTAS